MEISEELKELFFGYEDSLQKISTIWDSVIDHSYFKVKKDLNISLMPLGILRKLNTEGHIIF